jgi:putative membrane protein
MHKNKLSMAMLGASASFALLTALSAQAQSGTPTQQGATAPASAGKGATMPAGKATKPATAATDMTGQSSTQGSTASGSGKALNKADQQLVKNLAMANMAEIETAKMAQTKTQNEQVKSFAQRMIDDHTKALSDVQQLAQTKSVTLPTELDKAHKAKADKLAKLSGDKFDRAYMAQAGVADHQKTHAMVRSGGNRASDADVKALVAKLQPAVDEHLKMAQDMRKNRSATAAGSGNTATGSSGAGGTTAVGPGGAPGTGSVTGVNGTGTRPPAGKGTTGSTGTTGTERR